MRKVFALLREYLYALAPHLLMVLLAGILRLAIAGTLSYAQNELFQCPSPEQVWNFIATLQTMVLVVILVIMIFVLVFHIFGVVSTIAMRIGEFFNERIRFAFELLVIYVFFLMNFTGEMVGVNSGEECATVKPGLLFDNGPLFFRLMGWLLKLLGLRYY